MSLDGIGASALEGSPILVCISAQPAGRRLMSQFVRPGRAQSLGRNAIGRLAIFPERNRAAWPVIAASLTPVTVLATARVARISVMGDPLFRRSIRARLRSTYLSG
jgi:hypothetical protein